MGMYDSVFSSSCALSEQIARHMFEILSDGGAVMAILGRDGRIWSSDSERFTRLNLSESFLAELRAKIDDGAEPVVTQVDDCSIVAAQLATERTDCGYVLIALPQYSPELTLINIELIEIVLNQMGLIAELIEKNSRLYELQMKHFSTSYGHSEIAAN
ncbi:MAG TPA: hypothetical protein VMW16_13210 [Sedimentisphaerales bacterium]|nr:hypothetical protein [Sedimentisphaerales bacterium]